MKEAARGPRDCKDDNGEGFFERLVEDGPAIGRSLKRSCAGENGGVGVVLLRNESRRNVAESGVDLGEMSLPENCAESLLLRASSKPRNWALLGVNLADNLLPARVSLPPEITMYCRGRESASATEACPVESPESCLPCMLSLLLSRIPLLLFLIAGLRTRPIESLRGCDEAEVPLVISVFA